jgi:hypothetical protein
MRGTLWTVTRGGMSMGKSSECGRTALRGSRPDQAEESLALETN